MNPATVILERGAANGNAFDNEISQVDVSRDEVDPPTTESQRFWGIIRCATTFPLRMCLPE